MRDGRDQTQFDAVSFGEGFNLRIRWNSELVQQAIGPDARGPGRPFGPEMPCPEDAPVSDRLAAFLGRAV